MVPFETYEIVVTFSYLPSTYARTVPDDESAGPFAPRAGPRSVFPDLDGFPFNDGVNDDVIVDDASSPAGSHDPTSLLGLVGLT